MKHSAYVFQIADFAEERGKHGRDAFRDIRVYPRNPCFSTPHLHNEAQRIVWRAVLVGLVPTGCMEDVLANKSALRSIAGG